MPILFLLLLLIAFPVCAQTVPQTYHVNRIATCADGPGAGSEERPYCSVRYASTIAVAGDTFLIHEGRYGDGPAKFLRSGTSTAPITYRGIGDVVVGLFTDLVDEDFQAGPYPDVYSIGLNPAVKPSRVIQTYFPPQLVDDPNPSIFTMVDTDGPLSMTQVTDYATLTAREGTWLYDAERLHVHAYGDRAPSSSATDIVITPAGGALTVEASTQYNVFENVRVPYSGTTPAFSVLGSNNQFRNITIQSGPWALRGGSNIVDGLRISHVIARGETFLWHESGQGTALAVMGTGHSIRNVRFWHNWNSSISTSNSPGLMIEGLESHGAPNHCGTVASNATLRNAVIWNCQDYMYMVEKTGYVLDHVAIPQGILSEGLSAPAGPFTVRNSIFSGVIGYSLKSTPELCQWESGSLMEFNVISTNATIYHCADQQSYPIVTYQALCESGALTGCMTIRNNIMVSDFRTVMVDGLWTASLGDAWNVTLVPGSPAIGAASDGLDIGPLRDDSQRPQVPQGLRIVH